MTRRSDTGSFGKNFKAVIIKLFEGATNCKHTRNKWKNRKPPEKLKSFRKIENIKEQNACFRIEKYSNWYSNLSEWAQEQNGGTEERLNGMAYKVAITQIKQQRKQAWKTSFNKTSGIATTIIGE